MLKTKDFRKDFTENIVVATIIKHVGIGVLSFFLARTVIFENMAPFGAVLTAAVPSRFSPVAAVAAILGYAVSGIDGFRYISCVLLFCAVRWFLTGLLKNVKYSLLCPFLCFATITVSGFAFSGVSDVSAVVLVVSQGLISAASGYFFGVTFDAVLDNQISLSFEKTVCVVLSVSVFAMSLFPLTVADISPARIILVVFILGSARYSKQPLSAVFGTLVGFTMYLYSDKLLYAALGFAFGSLVSGMFSVLGRVGVAVSFVVSNGIVCLQAVGKNAILIILYEVLIASFVFMVMPKSFSRIFAEFLSGASETHTSDSMKKGLAIRLKTASEALLDVAKTTEAVSDKLSMIETVSFEKVFQQVEHTVCGRCSMKFYCWEKNRGSTLGTLINAAKKLKSTNTVSAEDLSREFYDYCARPDDILSALAENYTSYVSALAAKRRLCEVRDVVSEQFAGMSEMLNHLSDELLNSSGYDDISSQKIEKVLRSNGVFPLNVLCKTDLSNRLTVEIQLKKKHNDRVNQQVLLNKLYEACGRDFDVPSVVEANGVFLITCVEKARFSIDFGACSFAKDDNKFCGDAHTFFYDGKGRAILIISDGMGSGGRAAVDGTMASALMTRFIKAGFGFECSLKLVNSAMIFKSTDESVATLDICCIDLFNGCAKFYKAGAPETVVCRNKKAGVVEANALPPGILKDVEFEKCELQLSKGDKLVMLSDGALESGSDWIGVELETYKGGNAQQLAEHIADYAKRRNTTDHSDDVTVLAAIIN